MSNQINSPLLDLAEAHEKAAIALRAIVEMGIQIPSKVLKEQVKEEAKEPVKKITFEDLRYKLSTLSYEGHKEDVLEIISKRGVKKLSEIPKSEYEAVLKEADAIE